MPSTYRLHGSIVNRDEAYVDVRVTGVGTDGTVTLEEQNGIDSWDRPIEWLADHEAGGLAEPDCTDTSELWKALEDLQKRAEKADVDVSSASKELFRAAVRDTDVDSQ